MKWFLKYILQNITHSEGYLNVNRFYHCSCEIVISNVYGQNCLLEKYGNISGPLGKDRDHQGSVSRTCVRPTKTAPLAVKQQLTYNQIFWSARWHFQLVVKHCDKWTNTIVMVIDHVVSHIRIEHNLHFVGAEFWGPNLHLCFSNRALCVPLIYVTNFDAMTSFTPIPFLQFVEFVPELCLSAINPEENLQKLFTLSICCNKIFLCPRLDRIILNSIMEFCENILNIDNFNKREWRTKFYPGWYCQDVITNVSQGGRWQHISRVMGEMKILTLQRRFRNIMLLLNYNYWVYDAKFYWIFY